MKNLLLAFIIIISGNLFGQSNTCFTANPFCSENYVFPNATNSTAPNGPNYGCLIEQPNPIWYYMEIANGGTLQLNVSQVGESFIPFFPDGPTDVDFAMWGPFTSLSAGCTAIMGGGVAPIQCSFSSNTSETIGIGVQGGSGSGQSTPPAAITGQIYIVMLTNYEDTPGEITFNQTGGTGSADCSIVDPTLCSLDLTATVSPCNPSTNQYSATGTITFDNPPTTGQLIVEACDGTQVVAASAPFNASSYPFSITGLSANGTTCSLEAYFSDGTCSQVLTYTAPVCTTTTDCFMSFIDAQIDPCDAGNVFTLSGTVEFTDPPTTGQLIVEDCNGNVATYNAPFISPLNFQMTANANGQNCGVTAYFSVEPSCQINVDYQNTQPCDCVADIGTFTSSFAGESTVPYVLCYGDELSIESNDDFIPPGIALNPPLPEGYNPNIGWLLFSCPPTVGVVPHLTEDVVDDPCYIGLTMIGDFYDNNDLYFINQNPGVFTDNIVYWVPLTFYNTIGSYTYSFVNTDMPCYEMGTPYPVQYLPEITGTFNADCEQGTLSMTVQGGSPAINGTNFTAIIQNPSHANVTTNNVVNGGTLVVSGLQNGDNYSILVQDEFGCPIEFSGVFEGSSSAVITYPQTSYCKNVTNPMPEITGTSGGVFSGTPGLVINSTTGLINLSATPAGIYTVTYTLPSGACNTNGSFDIQIFDVPVVLAIGDAICPYETAILSASGADNFTWSPSNGLNTTTGPIVNATLAGTQIYTVIGVDNLTGCFSSAQATVFVDARPEAIFNSNPKVGTEFNPHISFVNHSHGASSYYWNFGDGATSTATNPSHSYAEEPGSYVVMLIATSAAGCVDTITSVVVIQEELIFYIPNTFTPDQDEFNQIFKPIFTSGFDPFDYSLQIYNRWGEMIFESNNAEFGWDGTYGNQGLCQDGTYTWKIEVKTSVSDERKMFVGHINLLR